MLRKHTPGPGVTDTLEQLRTSINAKSMWDMDEVHPYISGVSHTTYIEHVISVIDHLGGDSHVHTEGSGDDKLWFTTREVLQLVSEALDAPQEVLDYFSEPDNVVSLRGRLDRPEEQPESETKTFDFMGHQLRVIMRDEDPQFVLGDVCAALDLGNVTWVKNRLDQQDFSTAKVLARDGKSYQTTIVNESGLYDVVLDSRKPEAKKFRRWITSEVIPAINRTGSYTTPGAEPQFEIPQTLPEALRLAADLADKNMELESEVKELSPKAEFYDEFMDADGSYSFAAVARILGFGRNILMRELRGLGVLQANNLPYRRYDHHFRVTPGTYVNRKTGEVVPTATTTVLPTGLPFLRRKLQAVNL